MGSGTRRQRFTVGPHCSATSFAKRVSRNSLAPKRACGVRPGNGVGANCGSMLVAPIDSTNTVASAAASRRPRRVAAAVAAESRKRRRRNVRHTLIARTFLNLKIRTTTTTLARLPGSARVAYSSLLTTLGCPVLWPLRLASELSPASRRGRGDTRPPRPRPCPKQAVRQRTFLRRRRRRRAVP